MSVADPEMASQHLKGLIKEFAFWPQVVTGQPPASEAEVGTLIASAILVFLAAYRV